MAKKINIIANLIDKQFKRQVKELENGKYKINVDVNGDNVSKTTNNVRQLGSATASTDTAFGKLKSTIKDTFSAGRMSMTVFLAALHEINKAGKNAKQTIEDINKSITDLAIATNMSREATAGLVKDYNKLAKEMKSTTLDVSRAADDYLRAGKSMSEANELIKDSIMLSKLGQIDSSVATEDILATMNGYEMSIKDVGNALDAMVAIDMNAATSAGDLATGLKYSASSANSAGVSFNKLVAILGTVQDKTMQNAEVVGTFANTMLSRYRDVTIGKYLTDEGEDISNYESVLKSVGIALRDEQGEFRAFETVLQEMADKWNSLTSVQQNALIKVAAGTRQQNRFIALMEGYNKVLELTETAASSAGMAVDKFNNAFANSLEAKQNELQASFEAMVMNSDMEEVYAGILEATKALVDFMNETNALKGIMATLTVSGGIKFFLAVRSAINESYISLNRFANVMNIIKQTNIPTDDFNRLLLLSKGLSESQMKLLLSSNQLSLSQKELILVNSGLNAEEAKLYLQTLGLAGANESATVSFGLFTKAVWANVKAIGAWLLTTPAGWFTLLTGAAVGTALIFKQFNTTLNEAGKTLSEQNEKFQSLSKEISSLSDELKTATDRIKELESLPSLTIVEDEELQKLKDTTEELEYQLAIKKEEQRIEAQKTAKAANDAYNASFQHMYDGSGELITSPTDENWNPVQELKNTIKAYENYKKSYDELQSKITQDSNNGKNTAKDQNRLNNLKKQMVSIEEHAKEMFGVVNDQKTAYEGLYQAGYELGDTEMSIYEDVKSGTDAYQVFCNALNDTTKAYSKLSNEEKRQSILNKAILGGKTREEAQKIVDSISDDDLEAVAQIHFDRESSIQSVHDEIDVVKSEAESYGNELEMSVFSKSDMISSINDLSEGFEELDKIFSSISDKNPFDFKLLDDKNFKETFSGLESYADFVETISSNSDDIDACRDSFGELVKEWINGKGVLDNVNESTAQLTISMLENMGVANAEELVMASLTDKTEALALQEQFLAEYGYEIANASQYRIYAFLNEAGASETARQYLFALVAQEQVFNNQGLDVSGKISALKDLATQYGQTALAAKIAHAEEQAQKSHTSLTASDYANFVEEVNSAMNKVQVNYAGGNKSNKASGGSSKDAWKEAYEKELAELEHLHEMGLISDEEYYNQRIALNEKYFGEASGKHEKYLDEYRKNEEQIADGLKKLWEDYWNDYKDNLDKVSSYAEKLFQRQIDELNKKKDNSDDSYEKEIESIESVIKRLEDKRDKEKEYWQDQIDAIQNEIDSLQDANDERERALNLQKKMYELYRAMSQRSILQYSQEKGFHYVTNDSEIKDKKEEVDQAKFDITIANLQKQKDALEDKLDEITDKYDVQIEKLNYRKETVEKNMDAENKRIQEQIDLLEEQKSKWTEVADNIEFAMLEREMMTKYGSDVAQKILGGDVQFLNDFISQYEHATGVINSLNDATLNDIMNMAGQFGVYAENLGGVAGQIANDVGTVNDSAKAVDMSNVNTNLSDTANASANASDQLSTVTQKFNELTNEVSNYSIPALDTSNFASSLGIDGKGGVLGDLQSFIDKYKELCESIPKIWNDSLGVLVNGGGQVSGEERNYDTLFQPLLDAMTSTKTAIDTKLEEYKTSWTNFNADLGSIIGVGSSSSGGTESPITGTEQTGGNQQKSDKKKEGEADTSSIVGTITAGGEAVKQSFDDVWIPGFETFRDNIDRICSEVVACMDEMAKDAIEAAIKTIEAVNAANVATGGTQYEIPDNIKNWEGVTYTTPYSKESNKRGKAYAEGTKGLAHDEKNALRSEYGQPELTVYPSGEYEITNQPTISDLPKGTTVYDEEDTKKILNNKESVSGKALFGGTINPSDIEYPEWILGRDGQKYYPLQEDDEDYKLFQKFQDYMEQNQMQIIPPVNSIQKEVAAISRSVSNVNTRNTQQAVQFSTGDIIVQGVQNVDGFAKAIKTHFPNAMIQALNTTR